jgi:hypothetical protein
MNKTQEFISTGFMLGQNRAMGAHTVTNTMGRTAYVHHGTTCIIYNPSENSVKLYNGGHFSTTTKQMMNACLKVIGFPQIEQKNGVWIVNGHVFSEGMKIAKHGDIVNTGLAPEIGGK